MTAASPWRRPASALRRAAGEQRGSAAPRATRLSTVTGRAARAERTAVTTSAISASRPGAGSAAGARRGRGHGRGDGRGARRGRRRQPPAVRPPGAGRQDGGGAAGRGGAGAVSPRGGVGGTCGGAGARTGTPGPSAPGRLADVLQHGLEAADLPLDVRDGRRARRVVPGGQEQVRLATGSCRGPGQVADDLGEGLGELDVRADRAVEQLLRDRARAPARPGRG